MKFLAAALILFIGVTGDLVVEAASASAAAPASHAVAFAHPHHAAISANKHRPNPFVSSH
jgi:hypothetical protein